jgi:hypothetical protein
MLVGSLVASGCERPRPAPESVTAIYRAAWAVDADSARLSTFPVDFDDGTGQGLMVWEFRDGHEVRKVSARVYSQYGQTNEGYYLADGRPYLVVRHTVWFKDPLLRNEGFWQRDSLFYVGAVLVRGLQFDKEGVGSHLRTISTPWDSTLARLRDLRAKLSTGAAR